VSCVRGIRATKNVKTEEIETVILPAVKCGVKLYETMGEEYRLRVFENSMLWKILGPKSGKVRGGWKKLHMEWLYDVRPLPDIIGMINLRSVR
jgi:hypothetical protein